MKHKVRTLSVFLILFYFFILKHGEQVLKARTNVRKSIYPERSNESTIRIQDH